MKNKRFFSAYRPNDYHTPRSMREAYGYDARLWEEPPEPSMSWFYWLTVFFGVICWVGYGWI